MNLDAMLDRIVDGRTDLVWDVVAAGYPSDSSREGIALIQWCGYYGDVSAIRFLAGLGEPLAKLGDNVGLNGAAFHGHWRLCEFLLENGADANHAQHGTGETALHASICTPYRDAHDLVVEVLLAHGADPNRATIAGVPTDAFMRDCRTRGETPLHRAAAFGSARTIDMLLGAGASREARDANGDTPLSWGSWHARPDEILRRLCHGGHAIHPDRIPMRLSLLGRPRPYAP